MNHLDIDSIEVIVEWREGIDRRQLRQILSRFVLEEHARRGGSAAVRSFLRDFLMDHVVDPLISDVIHELVERERSQEELVRVFGRANVSRQELEDVGLIDRRPKGKSDA